MMPQTGNKINDGDQGRPPKPIFNAPRNIISAADSFDK
jgi:hypothetical protein